MFVYFLILATSLVVATSATDIVHPISPENWPAHADFDAMNMIEVQEKAESHLQEFYKANPTYSDLTIFQQPPYVKHLMFTRDAAEHNQLRVPTNTKASSVTNLLVLSSTSKNKQHLRSQNKQHLHLRTGARSQEKEAVSVGCSEFDENIRIQTNAIATARTSLDDQNTHMDRISNLLGDYRDQVLLVKEYCQCAPAGEVCLSAGRLRDRIAVLEHEAVVTSATQTRLASTITEREWNIVQMNAESSVCSWVAQTSDDIAAFLDDALTLLKGIACQLIEIAFAVIGEVLDKYVTLQFPSVVMMQRQPICIRMGVEVDTRPENGMMLSNQEILKNNLPSFDASDPMASTLGVVGTVDNLAGTGGVQADAGYDGTESWGIPLFEIGANFLSGDVVATVKSVWDFLVYCLLKIGAEFEDGVDGTGWDDKFRGWADIMAKGGDAVDFLVTIIINAACGKFGTALTVFLNGLANCNICDGGVDCTDSCPIAAMTFRDKCKKADEGSDVQQTAAELSGGQYTWSLLAGVNKYRSGDVAVAANTYRTPNNEGTLVAHVVEPGGCLELNTAVCGTISCLEKYGASNAYNDHMGCKNYCDQVYNGDNTMACVSIAAYDNGRCCLKSVNNGGSLSTMAANNPISTYDKIANPNSRSDSQYFWDRQNVNCSPGHGANHKTDWSITLTEPFEDNAVNNDNFVVDNNVEYCKTICVNTEGCDGITRWGNRCYLRHNMIIAECGNPITSSQIEQGFGSWKINSANVGMNALNAAIKLIAPVNTAMCLDMHCDDSFSGGTEVYTYEQRTSGKCPDGTIIGTIDECNRAAITIGWTMRSGGQYTAQDDGQSSVPYDPLGCYFEGGSLKFNNNGNSGQCTSRDKCICRHGQPVLQHIADDGSPVSDSWSVRGVGVCQGPSSSIPNRIFEHTVHGETIETDDTPVDSIETSHGRGYMTLDGCKQTCLTSMECNFISFSGVEGCKHFASCGTTSSPDNEVGGGATMILASDIDNAMLESCKRTYCERETNEIGISYTPYPDKLRRGAGQGHSGIAGVPCRDFDPAASSLSNGHQGCKDLCSSIATCTSVFAYDTGRCCPKTGIYGIPTHNAYGGTTYDVTRTNTLRRQYTNVGTNVLRRGSNQGDVHISCSNQGNSHQSITENHQSCKDYCDSRPACTSVWAYDYGRCCAKVGQYGTPTYAAPGGTTYDVTVSAGENDDWVQGSNKNCYAGHGASYGYTNTYTVYADQSTTVERCKAECLVTDGCDGITVWGSRCYKRHNMDLSQCVDMNNIHSYKLRSASSTLNEATCHQTFDTWCESNPTSAFCRYNRPEICQDLGGVDGAYIERALVESPGTTLDTQLGEFSLAYCKNMCDRTAGCTSFTHCKGVCTMKTVTGAKSWTIGAGKLCGTGHGATYTASCPHLAYTVYTDQSTTVEQCKAECLVTNGCDGITVWGSRCYKRHNMDLSNCVVDTQGRAISSYQMGDSISSITADSPSAAADSVWGDGHLKNCYAGHGAADTPNNNGGAIPNTNVEQCKSLCVATNGCSGIMTSSNHCYLRTGMNMAKCVLDVNRASRHLVSFQLHAVNQCKTYYRDLNTAGTNNEWKSYQMHRRMCPAHAPRCLGTSTYSLADSANLMSANKICKL